MNAQKGLEFNVEELPLNSTPPQTGCMITIEKNTPRLVSNNFAILQDLIQEQINEGKLYIALNLKNVIYVSSAGFGVIMGQMQEARNQEGDLVVCGVSPKITNLFDMLGFSRMIHIYETIEEAHDHLAQLASEVQSPPENTT